MSDDRFAMLRELLLREPSSDSWAALCSYFEVLKEGAETDADLSVSLAYADEHLSSWEPSLRLMLSSQMMRPHSILARTLWIEAHDRNRALSEVIPLASPAWSKVEHLVIYGGLHLQLVHHLLRIADASQVQSLRIDGSHGVSFSDDFGAWFAALCEASFCQHLSSLWLQDCGLNFDALMSLQGCESLRSLRFLDVSNNFLDGEGLDALAHTEVFSGLECLDISFNAIDDTGMLALSRSPVLRRLERLVMACELSSTTPLGAKGLLSLLYPSGLHSLRDIGLLVYQSFEDDAELLDEDASAVNANRFSDRWLASLTRHTPPMEAPFDRIHIKGFPMNVRLLEALLASPKLVGLRILALEESAIGNDGLASIVGCASLYELEELHLNLCDIGDSGLLALALSSQFTSLRRLSLNGNALSGSSSDMASEAVIALSRSRHFPMLEEIALVGNPLKEDGLLALAHTTSFPSLRKIYVGGEVHNQQYHEWLPSPPDHIEIVAAWEVSAAGRAPGESWEFYDVDE